MIEILAAEKSRRADSEIGLIEAPDHFAVCSANFESLLGAPKMSLKLTDGHCARVGSKVAAFALARTVAKTWPATESFAIGGRSRAFRQGIGFPVQLHRVGERLQRAPLS